MSGDEQSRRRLPRLALVVLSLLVRPSLVREDVTGDLTEAYGRRRHESGWRAGLWLWRQIGSLAVHRGWARLTEGGRISVDEGISGRRAGIMSGFTADIRYALRGIARSPAFAAAAILTIGLGVGANAAIFSVVNGVLLRPLPWPDASGLAAVWPEKRWSGEMLAQVRERTTSFESLSLLRSGGYTLLGEGAAERVDGARVSDNYFDVLRVRPRLGRTFVEGDRFLEGGGTAVISWDLWQRRYGGDPAIIGRTVRIAGFGRESRTIIGVMPPDYAGLYGRAEVWTPVDMSPDSAEFAGMYAFSVIGRVSDGRSIEAASAEMRSLVPDFSEDHPTQFREIRRSPVDVVALRDNMIGDSRGTLLILLAAVGIVLLIACTNVANLLLARSVHRRREHEVRLALGARPGRIVRQMLVESGMLGLSGGAAGVLIAFAATPLLATPVASLMPRDATSVLDLKVLGFAAAVSIAAGLLFGSVSAIRFSMGSRGPVLHDAARASTGGRGRNRVNNALVMVEVALAVLVVVAGALLLKSFRVLASQDPGFAPDRVLAVQVAPPEGSYADDAALEQYFDTLLERIRAIPAVENVSVIRYLPLTGSWAGNPYRVEGQDLPDGTTSQVVSFNVVTPDYFASFGMPLREGRGLQSTDRSETRVGVINEAFRDRHWPGESVIGRQVLTASGQPFFEIVGVVADIRQRSLRQEPAPEVYMSPWQATWDMRYVIARGDARHLRGAVIDAIRATDADVPIIGARTMDEVISDNVAAGRSIVVLFTSFAVLGLTLGMIGIYGLVSYTVSQRLREIGVRLALGATSGNVLRRTLGSAMALVGTGVALGTGLALAGTRLLSSILFGVEPGDPAVLAIAITLMVVAGAAASLIPALRAARSSPLSALRIE